MKTAMQDLKEEIQSKVFPPTYNDGNLTDYQYGHNVAYGVVLTIVEYLLEKEKEQICNAYTDGLEGPYLGAEEYYYDNYNQSIKKITITENNNQPNL